MANVKIMGDGTVSDGDFNNITIMGDGILEGEFTAQKLKVYGDARARESFEITDGKIRGNFKASKDSKITGDFNVAGEAEFLESTEVNSLVIRGDMKVKENLKVNKVNICGTLSVDGDCEADTFLCSGEVKMKGLLNCDNIKITLFGKSEINEIGCEKVVVKRSIKFLLNKKGYLRANLIEGDEVFLENTICKVVRGKNIKIGRGCTIDYVECLGELSIDKDSEVKEKKWKKD